MSIRSTYLLGFVLASLLLFISIYLQFVDGIMPCPLCSFQRATFGLLGIIFLIGIFTYKVSILRFFMNALAVISSILGIILAGRQIWLQNFSTGNNECGVSLEYMLHTFPINEVFKKIFFEGSAECSQRGWEFMYLNMAEWSLLWFVILLVLSTMLFIKEFKKSR